MEMVVWYGIVEFNVPLDTVYVISETGGDGGDSWRCRSCKAPVKSLPPTKHQVVLAKGCKEERSTGLHIYKCKLELEVYTAVGLLCCWLSDSKGIRTEKI